jgi:hypothetical protein
MTRDGENIYMGCLEGFEDSRPFFTGIGLEPKEYSGVVVQPK